jgi:hypothetical protein
MGIYNTYVLSNMGSLNPISFNNMHSHNWPLDLDKVFGHWPPIKSFFDKFLEIIKFQNPMEVVVVVVDMTIQF